MANTANVSLGFRTTEFKRNVKEMENALKTARNEFKLSDAQIKNTGTALEQMRNKSCALTSQLQQQKELTAQYKEGLRQANAEKVKTKKRLEEANAAYKEGRKQLEKNSVELKKLKEELEKAKKGFASSEKAINEYTNKLYNSQIAEEKLKSGIKSTNEEIRNQEKYITQVNNTFKELSDKTAGIQQGLSRAGRVLTASVTAPLVTAGIAAGKAAVDFEDAFAGIEKTVEATPEQFAKIRQGVRDMAKEIPVSVVELSKLGEVAGQLGIHTDRVLSFSRVIADLSVSTNLAGEEGASMLAKFANITQMPQENFERLGSVIVDLGNHLATTEADIAQMGQRLAGAGTQIGLTEAQILSLAGGLSSVGIEAEAGGSAFSKVMVNMQLAVLSGGKDLKKFAQVAGMGAAQFKKAFQTDAAGALLAFVEGLGKTKEQGGSAIEVLEDMGITEVRMRDALLRASSAGDLFRESLELGEKAWKENTALANEASKRYETTASQLQIMKNNIYDAGITLGETFIPYLRAGSEKLKEFAQYLSGLDEKQKERILKIGMALAALGPTLSVLSKGITVINGTRAAISALGTVTGGLGGAMTLLTGPVGIAITALAAAGAGAYAVVKANEAAQDAFYNLGDAIEAAGEKYDEATEKSGKTKEVISQLRELNEQVDSGTLPNERLAEAEQKRKELEQWIIDNYGDYITAEEQKNGIRQETLDKLEEVNEKLTEQRRLELESQVFEERKNIKSLEKQVESLKKQNEALEKQAAEAGNIRRELELLQSEWENFSRSDADETQKSEKLKEIAAKVEELTGKSVTSGAQIDAVLKEYADTVNDASRKMAENNEKIQDGEESISQYTDACRRLIELELGDAYDSFSASMDTLTAAQDKLTKGQKLSNEEMEKLNKLIPGFAENADKPQALTQKIGEMNQKLERACALAKSYGTDLRGIPPTVNTTVTTNFVTKGDYAAFKDGQGPRAIQNPYTSNTNRLIIPGASFAGGKNNDDYEGPAWVNDGNGMELIREKDGTLKMAKGRPALVYVNREDRIYTAEQTRKILNAYGFPAFASGKGKTAFETAKASFDYRKRTSEVSDAEELAWWRNVLRQYAGDAEAVKEANIEIYSLTKKLREQEEKEAQTANKNKIDAYKKQISSMLSDGEKWISREVKNNDMAAEEQISGYRRIEEKYRNTLTEMLENTELTEEEKAELFETYYEKRADLDDKILELQKKNAKELYDYQKELQDRYIEDRTYFGDWGTDDPVSAFERVREGLDRALAEGTITWEAYQKRLEEVGNALYEGRRRDSEQWLSDQKFYGKISEEEYIDGLERQKRYTQEYYDFGIISYRQYLEANRELDREIYSARKELNEQTISDYYDMQKKELDIRRKAIEEKYALEEKLEDREEQEKKLSDLQAELAKYEGAVTIEGKRKLQEIRDQIAEIEKQQRKADREAEKQAELDAVERQAEALETAKETALKKVGELTNGMNSLMTIYSGRQYEIAQIGYQNICSLVDRSNVKLQELFDAESAARSYAGISEARYGDSYTLYQSNYNTIHDRTEADIFGRSAGRVFQNISFRR